MRLSRTILKSPNDKRTIKGIELPNQLKCLLISDEEAEKSSAALSVAVGSLNDPLEAQGLAHYLEHMLFMGTKKYPSENDYASFITKNAGMNNAYTSQEETNFHFEVSSPAFKEALDMFAQFFIDPLMMESSSERELNAVDSEHSKNLQSDMWRKFQISKALAKPGHPYSKFSTGNKSTLTNQNLRKMLLDFYNAHYSSNLMNLVVYGKEPISELQKVITSTFQAVPNREYKAYKMTEIPFGEEVLGKVVKVTPVKDRRTLELNWILKDRSNLYKSSPARYVAHLLGHEGEGSLLSLLIKEGLATSLSSYGTDSYNCYSEFELSLHLTEKGINNTDIIIDYVFDSIEMLKKEGPQKWVFEEIRKVNKMKFQFLDKKQGVSFVSSVAKNLHKQSLQEILAYSYFMEEWLPETISEYLDELGSKNLVVFAESKAFEPECERVEPIYQSKYTVQKMNEIKPRQSNISLPKPNTFIPEDLTVCPLADSKYPSLLCSSKFSDVYFKADHRFSLPKTSVRCRLYFDGQNGAKEQICRSIFELMLKEKLREFSYLAETAELNNTIYFSSCSALDFEIDGFRDSFRSFNHEFVRQLLSYEVTDKELFETMKEKQLKSLANYFLSTPYQLAYNTMVIALRDGLSNEATEKLAIAPLVTFEDVVAFSKSWKQRIFAEIYISGNMKTEQAQSMSKEIEELIQKQSQPLPKFEIRSIRPVALNEDWISAVEENLVSKEQNNSCLIVHYQFGKMTLKTKILQELMLAVVKEPAFDYLRTKEQLGYVVMALPDDHRGVLGLSFLVQSDLKVTHQIVQYVDKFLSQILKQKIAELSTEVFEEYKSALVSQKLQKDKKLSSQATRFWTEIVKHTNEFERKEKEIELIPTITLEEFNNFVNYLFQEKARRLEIHVISAKNEDQNAKLQQERIAKGIKSYANGSIFKKQMLLYPDFYGCL